MADHKPGYIFVIVMTVLILIVALLINTAPGELFGDIFSDLFVSDTGTVSDELYLDVTPPGWAFSIWAVIYTWQVAWVIYAHTLLCRKTHDWQGYLYYRPNFMPLSLYFVYWLNLGLNVSWLIVFDRKILEAAVPILFATAITCYICLGVSYRALDKAGEALIRNGHKREIGLVRGFVHNGIGVYAGWTTVASLLNLGQALAYNGFGISQEDASSIVLGILGIVVIVYVIIDNFVTDRYSRYTFTPYFVLVYAITASFVNNIDFDTRVTILKMVDLILAVLALIMKIIVVIVRSREEPEPILRGRINNSKAAMQA